MLVWDSVYVCACACTRTYKHIFMCMCVHIIHKCVQFSQDSGIRDVFHIHFVQFFGVVVFVAPACVGGSSHVPQVFTQISCILHSVTMLLLIYSFNSH